MTQVIRWDQNKHQVPSSVCFILTVQTVTNLSGKKRALKRCKLKIVARDGTDGKPFKGPLINDICKN